MVWIERANPHYSCLVNLKGINKRKRSKWMYPEIDFSKQPIAHSAEMSFSPFSHLLELSEEEDKSAMDKENICRQNDSDFEAVSSLQKVLFIMNSTILFSVKTPNDFS